MDQRSQIKIANSEIEKGKLRLREEIRSLQDKLERNFATIDPAEVKGQIVMLERAIEELDGRIVPVD